MTGEVHRGDQAGEAYRRGQERLREIYAGELADIPEGLLAFNDVMMRTLFAEVWDRDVLSIRDRRLLLLGVIAARGAADAFAVHARAALRRGELDPDGLRETLVLLAPYAGYPVVAPLIGVVEQAIAEVAADGAFDDGSGDAPGGGAGAPGDEAR